VTVYDNRGICQHSGLCSDRLATAFRTDQEPFVAPSAGRMDEIIRAVRDCSSGALSYGVDGVEAREQVDWHGHRDPTIELTKDGPYRITGGLPLHDGRGDDVARAEGSSREHYALCRCGQSQNKPFCSGMHWYVDFHDPPPDPDATPTVFEWMGGLPALTRLTRLFYEKHIPQDPLLAQLFGSPVRGASAEGGRVAGGGVRRSEDLQRAVRRLRTDALPTHRQADHRRAPHPLGHGTPARSRRRRRAQRRGAPLGVPVVH
jgi:CDGSH-type Zn-finger protein/uncharacterized Fe-S cluster protein YjdI